MFLTEGDYKKAKENGISRELADDRFYEQGMTKKQTLKPIKTEVEKKEFTKEEKRKYLKIALANDINYQTYMRRLRVGWEIEKASTIPMGTRNGLETFASKERKYINKAMEIGISYDNYYSRRRIGWSKERASTTPIRKYKERKKCQIN